MNHQRNGLFRVLRDRAYVKQRGLCYWCKEPMALTTDSSNPRMLTGDHLVPYHNGGETKSGNIVAACRECNNNRHPYLNRVKKNHDKRGWKVGDDTHRSPFEVLKKCSGQ
jgi:5-methylcytosine-specific restriction endonuclease McrA